MEQSYPNGGPTNGVVTSPVGAGVPVGTAGGTDLEGKPNLS